MSGYSSFAQVCNVVSVFDESVEAKLKEVNLTKYFFRLGMPFNTQCNFTKRYKVEKACTLVAVSVKDSNKHLKCMASNT